jgi:hypothetical protein
LHADIIEKNGDKNMIKIDTGKKNRMSLKDHREMGRILQNLRNNLIAISVDLDKKYGKSKGLGRKSERAAKLIDKIRSELDDRLFNEYPEIETEEGCRYYYGI